MTPFDSLCMVNYYHPIVTLSVKCTVFEIWQHIGRKSPKYLPHFGMFLGGDPLEIFRPIIPCQKLESLGYQMVYISRSCFRSARHNTGVWWTDRQTCRCHKDHAMHSIVRIKMKITCNYQTHTHLHEIILPPDCMGALIWLQVPSSTECRPVTYASVTPKWLEHRSQSPTVLPTSCNYAVHFSLDLGQFIWS